MPTATSVADHPAPAWQGRLNEAVRRMASNVAHLDHEPDGPERAAGFVLAMAESAIRPEAEVPTRSTTRLDDGRRVECITGPGVLRLAFAEEVGHWTDPDVAEAILGVVRAAVAAELPLATTSQGACQ